MQVVTFEEDPLKYLITWKLPPESLAHPSPIHLIPLASQLIANAFDAQYAKKKRMEF